MRENKENQHTNDYRHKETFIYTYSAKQQDEINSIKQKYVPRNENKMEHLRRLDKSAEVKGTIVSIVLGVIGTMLLGLGMCCIMVWSDVLFGVGIIVGVLGIIVIAIAYPLYTGIIKKERTKIAPMILKLAEELEN